MHVESNLYTLRVDFHQFIIIAYSGLSSKMPINADVACVVDAVDLSVYAVEVLKDNIQLVLPNLQQHVALCLSSLIF